MLQEGPVISTRPTLEHSRWFQHLLKFEKLQSLNLHILFGSAVCCKIQRTMNTLCNMSYVCKQMLVEVCRHTVWLNLVMVVFNILVACSHLPRKFLVTKMICWLSMWIQGELLLKFAKLTGITIKLENLKWHVNYCQ